MAWRRFVLRNCLHVLLNNEVEKAKDCDWRLSSRSRLRLFNFNRVLLYIVQLYNLTYCEKGFELKHECHFNVRAEVDEVGISI